jgi:hypothetical protein
VPLASSCAGGVKPFHADYPRSDVVTQSLVDRLGARATVAVDRQTAKQVGRLLVTFVLPLLLLANLFALIFAARGGEGSMAEVAGFGRFQRRRQRERAAERTVTFADVAGAEHGHRCGRTADVDGERAPCGGGVDRPDGSPSRHYLTSSRRRGRAHGIASPLDAHAAASGCEDGEAST